MQDSLQYEGRNVVVTGTASGMGEAAAQILVDLGAKVTALDINDTSVAVAAALSVDLRDPSSIDAAVKQIAGPIDAVFSCAGLPGPPFSELDTMLVNFVGARHLIEALIPQVVDGGAVGCISSAAAMGWQEQLPVLLELFSQETFEDQKAWLEANEDTWNWSGYMWSKYAIDAWVGWRGAELIGQGIRLNCINPGPTDTAMMPAFHDLAGKELVDSAVGPIGRYSTASEQAWPLVMLNSPRMSYVCGEVLWTDGGFLGANSTGKQGGFADPEG
jgi:NAD(P)-dependent dehydrogenase (short-subunit alcohol dehydrogenase family)